MPMYLDPKDITVDVYPTTPTGGMLIGNRSMAVKVTHVPTKISVISDSARSQHANKNIAMQELEKLVRLHLLQEPKQQTINMFSYQTSYTEDIGVEDPLESRQFYELCQAYRHDVHGSTPFEELKTWIRANVNITQ